MSKKFAVMMLVLVAMLSSVFVSGLAFADDDSEDPGLVMIESDEGELVAAFADSRLNGLDMIETVAVYYDYDVAYTNVDGELEANYVVSAIELWVVEEYTNVGQLALYVPIADVEAAMASGADATIASASSVSLGYSASSDLLWVSGPNDYVFTWEPAF